MATLEYESPIGKLLITAHNGKIIGINFTMDDAPKALIAPIEDDIDNTAVMKQCISELESYFQGNLREFTVPMKLIGTDFRIHVWKALITIPYGETINYKELAIKIGNPKASRAVGGANHHNPINIIVPCHRVIGASGKLTGYGGGLPNKEFLLALEKRSM
ncbi:MAG: methylated-DNA--[protein]-cysteine S-methyltransferase [Defluviitaleaceae bacterium]|nr:methylated-DNA--[protein]-cysteine S-methyltransferase [Defluviitaleaceae bacterium]